jgi:single-strand DNA-binding protein
MQGNRFELTGYLAAKPEARSLPSGTRVANARLGQSYVYDTKDGGKTHTNWFSLSFYGELVTTALRFEKGDKVNVIGMVEQRQFTPKDGSQRTVYEVVVKQCRLVGRPHTQSAAIPGSDHKPIEDSKALSGSDEETDAWVFV